MSASAPAVCCSDPALHSARSLRERLPRLARRAGRDDAPRLARRSSVRARIAGGGSSEGGGFANVLLAQLVAKNAKPDKE